jgi:hypothetical protein
MTPAPPANPTVYEPVQVAINMARARLNDKLDTLVGVSGKILATPTDFSQQLVNNGWRCLRKKLSDVGYSQFTQEVVIVGFPIRASQDPAVYCWLSWAGCCDGVNMYPTPALPGDFISPLAMWERYTGQNMSFPDAPMEPMLNTQPNWPPTTWMGRYQWRGDAIWLPGSLQQEDFKISYVRKLIDFVDNPSVAGPQGQWYNQTLPLADGADALAWYIAAETETARKNNWQQTFYERGEAALKMIFNNDMRWKQRGNFRRQSRSGRLEGQAGYNCGYSY